MTVTSAGVPGSARLIIDENAAASIELAVAQWMRSPRATSLARERLRTLGVAEAEIDQRRRCRSSDPHLAALLRLAVTLMITRGRLEPRDRALLPRAERGATIAALAQATSFAFLRVALANEIASTQPYPEIDLEIGDY
jgi:hypothetical protein